MTGEVTVKQWSVQHPEGLIWFKQVFDERGEPVALYKWLIKIDE